MQDSTAVDAGDAARNPSRNSSSVAGTATRVPASAPGRNAAGGYVPFIDGDRNSSELAT